MIFEKSNNQLVQLTLWRLNEFLRRKDAIFWTYGFPLLMLLSLGFAFRDSAPVPLVVEIRGPHAAQIEQKLKAGSDDLVVEHFDDDLWQKRLQSGKVNAFVETGEQSQDLTIWADERRIESRAARFGIESAIRNPQDSRSQLEVKQLDMPGSRYIDFLVPGMLAMNLMGGGLWGVGFAIVDMRVRKLLKRLMATPMSRVNFLTSMIIVRMIFGVCELTFIALFSYFVFGVYCQGSYLDLAIVLIIGGVSFVGIGLLVASRVQSIEAVSGLMNLVMIPMWILGGVLFTNERFPEAIQPIIKILPIVTVVDSVRAIMLEGKPISDLWTPIAITMAWGIGAFLIALKIFRWR